MPGQMDLELILPLKVNFRPLNLTKPSLIIYGANGAILLEVVIRYTSLTQLIVIDMSRIMTPCQESRQRR